MSAYCPACQHANPVPSSPASPCLKCKSPLLIHDKWILVTPQGGGQTHDEVDGAVPVRVGEVLSNGERVAIRLGNPEQASRLEREATVLRGLSVAGVPSVLALSDVAGGGRALVLTHPPGQTLEQQLQEGLRTDGEGARRLAKGLLRVLTKLHALSPPVFHRNIHPGNVFWDGAEGVHLWDFARATDTVDDQTADLVLARPGYFPPRERVPNPAHAELYSVGATLLYVLSRKPPEQLPLEDGIPQYRAFIQVDLDFRTFLDKLLRAGTRRGFLNAAEALAFLEPKRQATSPLPLMAVAAGTLLLGGAGLSWVFRASPSRMVPVRPAPVSVTPPPMAPVPPSTPEGPNPPLSATVVLRLETAPAGAMVVKGGMQLGRTPLRVELPRGTAEEFVATLDGYEPLRKTLMLSENLVEHWPLRRLPAPSVAPRPQPIPVIPQGDDRVTKALVAALNAHQAELTQCNTDHLDRVRLRVDVSPSGSLMDVQAVGSSRLPSVECVQRQVKGLNAAGLQGGNTVNADVIIYFSPQFKIAVH